MEYLNGRLRYNEFIEIKLNDIIYKIENIFTIFQFCFTKQIFLPCFCYHERLSIAGNCRICLVQVGSKLMVSCAMPLLENMIIYTDNKRVRFARQNVLKFLLVNHPLDCPICDQGGECDLQDISIVFGSYKDYNLILPKRSVTNLDCCGPFVKTIMTRCIHCTRCVRFFHEIIGNFDIGVLGRGLYTEIGTYVEVFFDHELSANIIDLCPVGALLPMVNAFTARSWELTPIESIDVLDSLASSIRVDISNNRIIRILPCLDEDVNEEWITNKTRFFYDSIIFQRSNIPWLKIYNNYINVSWIFILEYLLDFILINAYNFLEVRTGNFTDLETAISIKSFFNSFGCSNINTNSYGFGYDFRANFLLNDTLFNLESLDIFLNIAINLRYEAPLICTRLRRRFLSNNILGYSSGLSIDYLTIPIINIGNSLNHLYLFLEGKYYFLRNFFSTDIIENNLNLLNINYNIVNNLKIFLGSSILIRVDGDSIHKGLSTWGNFSGILNIRTSIIPTFLGYISIHEVGCLMNQKFLQLYDFKVDRKILFLYGMDEIYPIERDNIFRIYQGPFLNHLPRFDIFLPITTPIERISSYSNLEGRFRKTRKIINSYMYSFTDLEILQALTILKRFKIYYNFSLCYSFYNTFKFFHNVINYFCIYFPDIVNYNNYLYKITFISNKLFIFDVEIYNPYLQMLNYCSNIVFCNSIYSTSVMNYYSNDLYSKNSKVLSLAAKKIQFSNFSLYRV